MDGCQCRVTFLLLLGLALYGCGGSTSEPAASAPDEGSTPPPLAIEDPDPATSDDDAPDEPAPDDAPLEAKLVTADELSPLDSFSVEFNQPVDPETLQDKIKLRGLMDNDVIPLDLVAVDSDQRLTLKPRYPLSPESQYVLDLEPEDSEQQEEEVKKTRLSEAEKPSQQPLPPVIVTRPNLTKSVTLYDDEDGSVAWYLDYRYHETGKVWMTTIFYDGPGPDNNWTETADNPISTVFTYELLSGKSYLKKKYIGPGTDGKWDLGGDDEIEKITLVEPIALPGFSSSITSSDPGANGEWFTADDDHYLVKMKRFDAASRELLSISGSVNTFPDLGPGEDNEWFTGDDRIEEYSLHYFDAQLRLKRIETFRRGRGEGDDKIWFTQDDEWTSNVEREYDELGRLSHVRTYFPPGPFDDGIKLVEHESYVYEGNSQQYRYLISHDPATGDISTYISIERDESGAILRNGVFLDPGSDQTWFTPGDSTSAFSENVLNEDGLVMESWRFNDVGDDGMPYTGNENVTTLTLFQYDEKGRLLEDRYFTGPGDDGVWTKSGDQLGSWDVYYIKPGT